MCQFVYLVLIVDFHPIIIFKYLRLFQIICTQCTDWRQGKKLKPLSLDW